MKHFQRRQRSKRCLCANLLPRLTSLSYSFRVQVSRFEKKIQRRQRAVYYRGIKHSAVSVRISHQGQLVDFDDVLRPVLEDVQRDGKGGQLVLGLGVKLDSSYFEAGRTLED